MSVRRLNSLLSVTGNKLDTVLLLSRVDRGRVIAGPWGDLAKFIPVPLDITATHSLNFVVTVVTGSHFVLSYMLHGSSEVTVF